MEKTKILIVDDHAILRNGLTSLLNAKKEFAVIGSVSTGEAALEKAARHHPDVVIMDLVMPGMNGIEATRRIRETSPESKVLILTTFGTSDDIAHALEAGATGAVLKSIELPELMNAIRTIAAGGRVISRDIEQILANDPPVPALSARQREILLSIARGLSNADIANQLGIGLYMVKEHVNALCNKLGAANRTEAVAIALRKHLLKL